MEILVYRDRSGIGYSFFKWKPVTAILLYWVRPAVRDANGCNRGQIMVLWKAGLGGTITCNGVGIGMQQEALHQHRISCVWNNDHGGDLEKLRRWSKRVPPSVARNKTYVGGYLDRL